MKENFYSLYLFISGGVSICIFLLIFFSQIKFWIKGIEYPTKLRKKLSFPFYAPLFFKWSLLGIAKGIISSVLLGIGIFALGKIVELVFLKNTYIVQSFTLFPLVVTWIAFSFIYFRESVFPITPRNKSGGHEKAFMLFLNILAPSVKNELKILAGGLCPHFYGDDRIISMLTYLKQKGVNIILLALDPDKIIDEGGTQEHLERVKKNVIAKFRMAGLDENLFFLSKRPKGSQFIIVDRETLRLEDPHPPWWSREIETFESTIYIKKPYIARYYEEKFNELLSKSEARVFN